MLLFHLIDAHENSWSGQGEVRMKTREKSGCINIVPVDVETTADGYKTMVGGIVASKLHERT